MTTALSFGDLETTGLDPDVHDAWEVALVRREVITGREVRVLYQIRPDLTKASEKALEISGFHDRFVVPDGADAVKIGDDGPEVLSLDVVRRRLTRLMGWTVLIGNNVAFDAAFLKKLLDGATPWKYRTVDVVALAAAKLNMLDVRRGDLPWSSEQVSRALGIEPPGKDTRHTALGDAMWARDMFDAVVKL